MRKARRARRDQVERKLAKLTRYFGEEIVSRDWGADEYRKLIKESKAAGDKVADDEREMARRILAAVDRSTSIVVASGYAADLLNEKPSTDTLIAPSIVHDALHVLADQARHASADAAIALLSVTAGSNPFDAAVRRLPFAKAAAALARLEVPSEALGSTRKSPNLRPRRMRSADDALRDAVSACLVVERAIGVAVRLVESERKARRKLEAEAVRDLFSFVAKVAAYAQGVLTGGVASGIEGKVGRRSPPRTAP
jgi:hypothetical protein